MSVEWNDSLRSVVESHGWFTNRQGLGARYTLSSDFVIGDYSRIVNALTFGGQVGPVVVQMSDDVSTDGEEISYNPKLSYSVFELSDLDGRDTCSAWGRGPFDNSHAMSFAPTFKCSRQASNSSSDN